MGATAVQVAGQLDDHQPVMLLAYLGLQVAAVTFVGTGQILLFVGLQGGWCGAMLIVFGQLQQAFFDDAVELGQGREVDHVDVHQRAVALAATGFDMLPGVALDLERGPVVGREQALAGAQSECQHGHGSQFDKCHDDPCRTGKSRPLTVCAAFSSPLS
ncbi:hypothetical protein YSA_03945 [Pseudomonas putida ND6]|uniref:Uncharacterized protein n=1 Tax=Pseudomonas putida ND6 TaxID=231023 RepID=I3UTT0_PSEPU|nr:hypothetical protein YSA_03945 [Pseudomonas putida ND6]